MIVILILIVIQMTICMLMLISLNPRPFAGRGTRQPRSDERVPKTDPPILAIGLGCGIRSEASSRFLRLKKAYPRPHLIGKCMKDRRVRFHRVRDFKQHYSDSIPPMSHRLTAPADRAEDSPIVLLLLLLL